MPPCSAIESPRVRKFRYLTVSVSWLAIDPPSTMRLVPFHSLGLFTEYIECGREEPRNE